MTTRTKTADFDKLAIMVMQRTWESFKERLEKVELLESQCYEAGMSDMAETYAEEADELWLRTTICEDWLIDHNAPGWVAT